MPNICGKAYGFTAFTPMKPWKTPFLRLFLQSVPLLSGKWIQRLLAFLPLVQDQKRLLELSFIHYARWSIVRRDAWPYLGEGQARERPAYDYLMFCSNFNGTWEQYIEAFSDVIPGGMNLIWRWSEKFPGAEPISPFLDYIRRVQYDNEFYYSAYPGASANDVSRALKLAAALETFAARTADLAPDAFAAAYERFLLEVQDCLGSTGLVPYIFDWEEDIFPDGAKPEELGPRGLNTPVSVGALADRAGAPV